MAQRARELIVHGCYGAFVASLLALLVNWYAGEHVSWGFVLICSVFGFVFAGLLGVRFIESLGSLLRSLW